MISVREVKTVRYPRVVERYECDQQSGEHVTISLQAQDVFWGDTEVVLEKTTIHSHTDD